MTKEMTTIITNDDFNKPIWIYDFHKKDKIISLKYKRDTPEALYTELTGSLNEPCFLNIEDLPKRKIQKVNSFHDIQPFIERHDKVLIYP
ncbi:hypothetical protein, partial [Geomonas propionica]|uniref:hypothetical protein n=1 Tax=Geomonas propionica TaxID=2798582 RepID=UPI001C077185